MAKRTALGLEINATIGKSSQNINTLCKSFENLYKKFDKLAPCTSLIADLSLSIKGAAGAFSALSTPVRAAVGSVWEYSKSLEKAKTSMSTLVAVNSASITSTGQMLNAMQKFNLANTKSTQILEQFKKTSLETGYSVSDLGDMFRSFYSTASSKMSLDQAVKAFQSVSVAASVSSIDVNQMQMSLDNLGSAAWGSTSDLRRAAEGWGITTKAMKDALADGKLDELLINKTKAFGDFMAVTARTYERQSKLLVANFHDLTDEIGDAVLHSVTSVLQVVNMGYAGAKKGFLALNDSFDDFSNWCEKMRKSGFMLFDVFKSIGDGARAMIKPLEWALNPLDSIREAIDHFGLNSKLAKNYAKNYDLAFGTAAKASGELLAKAVTLEDYSKSVKGVMEGLRSANEVKFDTAAANMKVLELAYNNTYSSLKKLLIAQNTALNLATAHGDTKGAAAAAAGLKKIQTSIASLNSTQVANANKLMESLNEPAKKVAKSANNAADALRRFNESHLDLKGQALEVHKLETALKELTSAGVGQKDIIRLRAEEMAKIKAKYQEKELLANEKFLKAKNNQLEKYYIMKGDIEKAWELRKQVITKDFDKLSTPQRKEMLAAREKDFKASFKKTNEEMQTSYLETIANMRKTTESVFFDFIEGKIRSLSQLFKRLGQSLISNMLNPLITSISGGLSSAFGSMLSKGLASVGISGLFSTAGAAGVGAAASGGFSLGSLLSPLSDLGSILSAGSISGATGGLMASMLSNVGWLTEGLADFAGGLSLAGNGLGGLSTALGASTNALAGFGVGLASNVLGGFGIGKLAGDMMDKLFGTNTHAGQYGAIGAAVGSILPGVGTLIGGAIGSVIGGIFGKWEHVESGLALVSDQLLSVSNTLTNQDIFSYDKSEKKGWFSSKEKTEYGTLANKQLEVINTMFDNVHALAARLGADLDRLVIKAGQYANNTLSEIVVPDTLLNSFLNLDVSIKDFAEQRVKIIQAAMSESKTYAAKLQEMFSSFISMSDSMNAYLNRGNPVKVALDSMNHSLDSFKMMMRNVKDSFKGIDINSITNIAQITAKEFTDAMNSSLHSDFSPQNLALWQQLGQAFLSANESVKKLLETVINKTAELSKSMGGFMEANGMSGGIMQVGSLLSKYMLLFDRLEGSMSTKLKQILADPFTASKNLASAGLGSLSQFLANDKDGYKKELINTLNSLKSVFNKQGGLAFSVPALDQIAAIDKQLKELSDPNSVAGKKDQLSVLQAQLESLKKQEGILRKLHNQAAGFRSTANKNLDYVNRAFNDTLAAAKEAFAKGDFDSKVYDELSKLASDKAGLLKEFSGSEADYKFGMLQMANALDSVGGKKTVASVQDEIVVLEGKIEDLKKQLGIKVDDNTKSTREKLEEQKQQLIIEAQKQVDAISQYLGNGSPVASYLQAVINGVREGTNITGLNLDGLNKTMGGVGSKIVIALNNVIKAINGELGNAINPNINGGDTGHQSQSKPLDAQHKQLALQMLGAYGDVHNWNPTTISWLINAGYDASYTDPRKNDPVLRELIAEFNRIKRGGSPSAKLRKVLNQWMSYYHINATPFARGGIVTGPTNALIGEAGYPEAVIPLKNGAGLKVDISGFGNLLAAKLETLISLTSKVYETGKNTAKNTNISMRIARDSVQ